MRTNKTIEQLRTLNELFACTGESTRDSVEHVRRILDFASETHGTDKFDLSLSECADRLAQLHFGPKEKRNLQFAHWQVPIDEQFSPLWIQRALIARMKRIAGARTAFLLITGLREAICPEGSYWTEKRQGYYDRVCNYVNELVCAWSNSKSLVQVVFL